MNAKLFLIFSVFLIISILSSCSRVENPTIPSAATSIPLLAESDAVQNGLALMGSYTVKLDPVAMTVEMTPLRKSTIGESYLVDGMKFFTWFPCTDCFNIEAVTADSTKVTLMFSAKHPLLAGNPALPPSGSNRLDLDVFDLAIVIKPSTFVHNYLSMNVNIFSDCCINPDGYTSELSNIYFLGQVLECPYYLPIDNDSITGITNHNAFHMGGTKYFEVIFKSIGSTIFFDLYLTMGYGMSATFQQRLTPKYYNPEYNRKAAWKVIATPQGNWSDSSTSSVNVKVEVYDWQQGATVYLNPSDFANAPSDQIYSSSNVQNVSIEIPGFYNGTFSMPTPDSGTGMPGDPLIFMVSVSNTNLAPGGTYIGLVKVLDERIPDSGADPKRDCIIATTNGKFLYKNIIPEYATYQTFTAYVIIG